MTFVLKCDFQKVRNLAAPFQNQQQTQAHSIKIVTNTNTHPWGQTQKSHQQQQQQQHIVAADCDYRPEQLAVSNFVDYRNFEFTELEDFSSMTFERYAGPTPESNWVLPNRLLVGVRIISSDACIAITIIIITATVPAPSSVPAPVV